MTTQTSDAALLTAPDINDVDDASDINVIGATRDAIDEPASAVASTPSSSGGRERIHQFAGVLHQAIDKLETLAGNRGDASAAASGYTSKAGQYGQALLEQFKTRPLRSVGIALGSVMVLRKILGRSPTERDVRVKVVQVPVTSRSMRDYSGPFIERRANSASRWFKGAEQQLTGTAGLVAERARSRGQSIGSSLARNVGGLPYQMRQAAHVAMAKGQQYGAMASAGVRSHPAAGLGVITAAAAILTTLVLRRR